MVFPFGVRLDVTGLGLRMAETVSVTPPPPPPSSSFGPEKAIAEYHDAQPVAERSGQTDVAQMQRIGDDQKRTAGEIHRVLVAYQQVLPVLSRGHQRVEDKCVGCRSDNADARDRALEIEIGTARRR